MTSLDNTERKFYQDTIANLLQYNGMLISALVSRGQQLPIPPMPSFGIELNLDNMKKMQSAWKDSPLVGMDKMMSEMYKRMAGVKDDRDTEEDPLK